MSGQLLLKGSVLSLIAGIIWSFGPLVVRHMESPDIYQLEYLFYRGLAIGTLLLIYQCFKENPLTNLKNMGYSGFIGACALAVAMFSFILSITQTTAAVTLLMLTTMPFISAVLGRILLKEKLSSRTLVNIVIASIGVLFIIINKSLDGSWAGGLLGALSSFGFSVFSITLRWRRNAPQNITIAMAGFICMAVALIALISLGKTPYMMVSNVLLSTTHGIIVAFGLILYGYGSKYLPAAELSLLSLLEVGCGIFWVWLPIFGINETPDYLTMLGGAIIFLAVGLHVSQARHSKMIPL